MLISQACCSTDPNCEDKIVSSTTIVSISNNGCSYFFMLNSPINYLAKSVNAFVTSSLYSPFAK